MRVLTHVTFSLAALNFAKAVHFLGRVNPSTRELTWPGTGISFRFTGSSATIGLDSVTGTNSVELTVDGIATIIKNVNSSKISTPSGLAKGDHLVQLRKRSEGLYGSIIIGNVTTDGIFGKDVLPSRRIEVIGDSITVGYGLDGVLPCTNNAELEDNPKTYAAIAAEALKADYSMIAWSGIGLIRNYASTNPDPSPIMPVRWTKYGANDVDNSYTFPASMIPDVVVINLGTNDFSYLNVRAPINASNFTTAMVTFVNVIKTHYPFAEYFLLTSPMLSDGYPSVEDAQKTTQTSALNAAIGQLNSTKIHLVDWPTQGSDVGCDYHPNAATHAAEAKVLATAIANALGW